MKLLKDLQFVCLDTELTGLDPDADRVMEIAVARFTLCDILDSWETLIDPEHPISEGAQKVHHISVEMIQGKPKIAEVLPHLSELLKGQWIVGHAINFDLQMLQKEAERSQFALLVPPDRVIDTLRLARHYGDSPNNSLETLAKHFNVEIGKTHRAMDDVMMNISVFRHLVHRFKTLKDIQKVLDHPIQMKYMPLGKYKGRLFSEIPLTYLKWAVTMEFDQDLLYSIKLELKKRKKGGGFSQVTNPFSQL
ncbi:MAG: DUF3820 family protein [Verrucomicrobia bacterium]|nr:DUF3820 family protein [Verrucomicrobiota bacterium]MBS0647115.1 DUF3820 family protein [Verrucomicrobiota bacterium]